MEPSEQVGAKFCRDHESELLKGFCKDCFSGICFRCAIGKHRNHNIIMLDEINKGDLSDHVDLFESKLDTVREKATSLFERASKFESHNDKLPEILDKFRQITALFEEGHYKNMIVGELQKNYLQINEMSSRLD